MNYSLFQPLNFAQASIRTWSTTLSGRLQAPASSKLTTEMPNVVKLKITQSIYNGWEPLAAHYSILDLHRPQLSKYVGLLAFEYITAGFDPNQG